MNWNIVTDSSCDLLSLVGAAGPQITYTSVPFVISVGSKDYVDDDSLQLDEMLNAMEQEKKASHTSCPSPAAWIDAFRQDGPVIAITISKNLSGSYNSACAAREMLLEEEPQKRITIINSASAGPALILLVRKLCQNIRSGMNFEEVSARAQQDVDNFRTIFALCSFDNLVKNGRMPRLTGFVAQKLGFWGIGVATKEGTISIAGKTRGAKKAIAAIIEDMKTRSSSFHSVVISHCQNEAVAQALKEQILAQWHDLSVELHLTKGLCGYYAERSGLIVTYT